MGLCFAKAIIVKQSLLFFLFFVHATSQAIVNGAIANDPIHQSVVGFSQCSAVLIHPRVLLTAAHCGAVISEGGQNLYFSKLGGDSRWVDVLGFHAQPRWQPQTLDPQKQLIAVNDDIAVIVLRDALERSEWPSSFPKLADTNDSPRPDEELLAVGFGLYRQSRFRFDSDKNSYRRSANYRIQTKKSSVFFIKSTTAGVGVCFGDSGGALFSQRQGQIILQGILTTIGGGRCA